MKKITRKTTQDHEFAFLLGLYSIFYRIFDKSRENHVIYKQQNEKFIRLDLLSAGYLFSVRFKKGGLILLSKR